MPPERISAGSRPQARPIAARAIRSGAAAGSKREGEAGPVLSSSSAPAGSAPRSSSSSAAAIAAGSWPGARRTERSQRASGGTIVRV